METTPRSSGPDGTFITGSDFDDGGVTASLLRELAPE
jgi:hypothetical protein